MQLELPTIQNWNCHNCAGCCREHLIEITLAEKEKIEKQRWEQSGEIPAGQRLIETFGPLWSRRYRLAHQADGACVFLNEQGLCRIHAKHGEQAKPMACRVYPYAFHPAGKKAAVSLRFSCPSAIENKGTPVSRQPKELQKIAAEVIPDRPADYPAPAIASGEQLDWNDFFQFQRALDGMLAETTRPIRDRVLQLLAWSYLIGQSRFEKIRGARLAEYLQLIGPASESESQGLIRGEMPPPSRAGLMLFRLLVAQYARKDTELTSRGGFGEKLRRVWDGYRIARGKGELPAVQQPFQSVPFAALEEPFGELPAAADELFTRYFRVKVQGLHFCGPAFYETPLTEGLDSLLLMFPVTLYIARWLAVSAGRSRLELGDVRQALALADHQHGYSPALGFATARRRTRLLASTGDIARLVLWETR